MSLSHRCAEATGGDGFALRVISSGRDNMGYRGRAAIAAALERANAANRGGS